MNVGRQRKTAVPHALSAGTDFAAAPLPAYPAFKGGVMQHFFHIRPLADIITYLEGQPPLAAERAALESPLEGRVLAEDIVAREDLPQYSRACMDGYAVRAADICGASEQNPAYLHCAGQVRIDSPAEFSVQTGQCAGIVTGGCLPEGADAVVMVEQTLDMGADCIEIRKAAPPRDNVMLRGEDARTGAVALPAGTVLRPQEIGLLAALGITQAPVFRRPRVTIISTGDELVPPQAQPRPAQVRDVNSAALAALTRQAGGVPHCAGIVPDTLDALDAALRAALPEADVVLLSGGSSVGVRDFTLAALRGLPDTEIFCHGAALSPGKPLILARAGQTHIWGLPGQVTSAQVVMLVLGQPFLRSLQGRQAAFDRSRWPALPAVLARNVASRQGREDFVRVRLEMPEPADRAGALRAVPVTGKSGLLRTMLLAQGLIHIPAAREGLEAGTEVSVLLFDN